MNSSVIEQSTTVDLDEPLAENAADSLIEIVKLLHAGVARLPGARGLSIGQIKAIGQLAAHGRQTVGEIAAGIGIAMPTASEAVDRLVEAGLAERAVNPANRRQVHVWLTPPAAALGAEIRLLRQTQLHLALSRLTPDERAGFARTLRVVADSLRQQASATWTEESAPRDR